MGCSAGIPKTKEKSENFRLLKNNSLKNNLNSENSSLNNIDKDYSENNINNNFVSNIKNNLLFSELEKFNLNFKDNQGIFINKIYNFKISFGNNILNDNSCIIDKSYYFTHNKIFNILENDILKDVNFINLKNNLESFYEYKNKIDLNNSNSITFNQIIYKDYNFVFKLRVIDLEHKFKEFDFKDNSKNFIFIFYDILSHDAIMKIKEIHNLINQLKINNLILIPIMNIFVDESDDLIGENNFLKNSGLNNIENYIMTKNFNTNFLRLFCLESITKNKVFLFKKFNKDKEPILILNDEVEFLNNDLLKYYLNLDRNELKLNTLKYKKLLIEFNLFFNNKLLDRIKLFKNNFKLNICVKKIKLNCSNNSKNNIQHPINININYNIKDKDCTNEIIYSISNFFSNFNKTYPYFINKIVEENNKINFILALNQIQKFLKNELKIILKKFEIKIDKSNKNLNFKEKQNQIILKIDNESKSEFIKIHSYLSENLYTNPIFTNLKLRFKIIPDKNTQIINIENCVKIKKEIFDDDSQELVNINLHSPNKKIILILNPNFITKLNKEKETFNIFDKYISILCDKSIELKIEFYIIIFSYNVKDIKICNLFSNDKMKIENEKFIKYFLPIDDINNYKKLFFYSEDFNMIHMILDENSKIKYFDDMNKDNFITKEILTDLNTSKNININFIDKLITNFEKYNQQRINKENFKKIKKLFLEKFEKIKNNLISDNSSIITINSFYNISYEKKVLYSGDELLKIDDIYYENIIIELRFPDSSKKLFLIEEINNSHFKNKIKFKITIDKIVYLDFTQIINNNKIFKCFICNDKIETDNFYFCEECNITENKQNYICIKCHNEFQENNKSNPIIEEDEDGFFNSFILDKNNSENKIKSIHNHNLMIIKYNKNNLNHDNIFYIQNLYDNYSNILKEKLHKCLKCEEYIYTDLSNKIYLIISQLNIYENCGMFICEECFNKGEEYYKKSNNKISDKINLIFLEIKN